MEEVETVTKVPGCLQEMKITWTPQMVSFIGCLARTGKMWIETTPQHSKPVEDKYFKLTGDVLIEIPGKYVVAGWDKWGTEAKVSFDSHTPIPDSVRDILQPSTKNVIDRNDFFWSLVRLGFRVNDKQDVSRIRSNVPEVFRDRF